MSARRLSAPADRPRRHLRVIEGRPLVEQVAVATVRALEELRADLERAPAGIRRIVLTIAVADCLAGRVTSAIERADVLAATGTDG